MSFSKLASKKLESMPQRMWNFVLHSYLHQQRINVNSLCNLCQSNHWKLFILVLICIFLWYGITSSFVFIGICTANTVTWIIEQPYVHLWPILLWVFFFFNHVWEFILHYVHCHLCGKHFYRILFVFDFF